MSPVLIHIIVFIIALLILRQGFVEQKTVVHLQKMYGFVQNNYTRG
jgi:hypothetical protein